MSKRIALVMLILVTTFNATCAELASAHIEGDWYLGMVGRKAEISMQNQHCSVEASESSTSTFFIVFICNDRQQVLWDINKPYPGDLAFDDPLFSLIWAGDKDHDGQIDLEMEMSPKYSCTKPVLYLSSLAEEGHLIGVSGNPITRCPY